MAARPRTRVVKRLSYILHADSEPSARRDTTDVKARPSKKQTSYRRREEHMAPYDRDSLTAEKRWNTSEKPVRKEG